MNTKKIIILLSILFCVKPVFSDVCNPFFDKLKIVPTEQLQSMKQDYDKALVSLVQKILVARNERDYYQKQVDEGNKDAILAVNITNNILRVMEEKEKCLIMRIKEIEQELQNRTLRYAD